MSSTPNSLEKYYRSQKMSASKVDQVISGCQRSVRMWRLSVAGAVVGVAVLAIAAGILWTSRDSRSVAPLAEMQQTIVVAVKAHGDRCSDCASLPSVVSELQQKHQDDDVMFLMHDMANDSERLQSERLLTALGVTNVFEGRRRHRILMFDENRIEREFPVNVDPDDLSESLSDGLGER